MKQRRLSPEQRREQLIMCAIMCYADLGVMRAGHGDVAKRANVSTATVFNYFPTCQALTEAVFQEVSNVFEKMFDTFPAGNLPLLTTSGWLSGAYEFLISEHPDVAKVVLNWSSTFSDDVRPSYLKFQSWVLKSIDERLNSPRDDNSDSRLILASAYEYTRMKLDGTDQQTLDNFSARLTSALSAR